MIANDFEFAIRPRGCPSFRVRLRPIRALLMNDGTLRAQAIRRLVVCNALWGVSFPTLKALLLTQQESLPGVGSWFLSALGVVYRFGFATGILAMLSLATLKHFRRIELIQGVGLGLFAGGGILFQLDGLAHTSASTSAFLTQGSCVFIPLWTAWRTRRLPAPSVIVGCTMAVIGVAVLADVDWQALRIGRGELETIIASVLFSCQILWLDKPAFRHNNPEHCSLVMFGVMALLCLPVALATTQDPRDWLRAYDSPQAIGFMGIVVVLCTLGAFRLMNRWQRHVTATEAGIIYCLEPIFASLYALFLPGIFSRWTHLDYRNESPGLTLILGGGLITAANILVQFTSVLGRSIPDRTARFPTAPGNETRPG